MKFLLAMACLATATFALPIIEQSDMVTAFQQFKIDYNRKYESPELEAKRALIFADNAKFIEMHNAKFHANEVSFEVGINQFADLSVEEFAAIYNGYRMPPSDHQSNASFYLNPANVQIPETVDWRKEGMVTPVKDQGQCGSCWSFSSTGSLEAQHFRKTGKLVSLSEQNLVDCSGEFGNAGCGGGWMDQAFDYIKKNKGIDTEQSYPYEAENEKCRYNPQYDAAQVTGYHDITKYSESALQEAVATVGPVSVAIDAAHRSFQLYKQGLYTEPMCSQSLVDHAVLVVGYGTESMSKKPYWLVKNSWSTTWGDQGYIKMERNNNNMCGIASFATYPLV